jgi:hypothetical protein
MLPTMIPTSHRQNHWFRRQMPCLRLLCAAILLLSFNFHNIATLAQDDTSCLANPTFNQVFVDLNGGTPIPTEGSCCQKVVCNIPCPATSPQPGPGYGIAVGVVIFISFAFGLFTYFWVGNKSENYFDGQGAL